MSPDQGKPERGDWVQSTVDLVIGTVEGTSVNARSDDDEWIDVWISPGHTRTGTLTGFWRRWERVNFEAMAEKVLREVPRAL